MNYVCYSLVNIDEVIPFIAKYHFGHFQKNENVSISVGYRRQSRHRSRFGQGIPEAEGYPSRHRYSERSC